MKLIKTLRLTSYALIACSASMFSQAATESVSANVEFVAPVTITENSPLEFGLISTDMISTNVITLSTANGVTDTTSRVVGGSQAAASLTVTAQAAKTINISVGSLVSGTGYVLSAPTCDYDGEGSTACGSLFAPTATETSATLLVGATITGNGSDVAGAANGSFVVTVVYP